MPIVASAIKGETVGDEQEVKPKLQIYSAEHGVEPKYYSGFNAEDIPYNSIAIIPIEGPIMKSDGYCGQAGTERMTKWVKEANANPNISAILFKVDSPGGQVDGTQTLAQAINASEKPTMSFISDGMACSAGIWLASAADEVWISQKTDIMGSVGVYVSFADIKKYWEAQGLTIHEIYADQSSEKNRDYREALKGNYKRIKEGTLNPIAEEFTSAMLDYRAGKIATEGDHLKGATYMGQECIDIGFADAMGSFDKALEHLAGRAAESTQNQFFNNQINSSMKFKSAWTAFKAVLGFENAASEDEMPLVTEERLEQLNSSLEAANGTIAERDASIAQLQAELTAITEERDAATATVATLTTERDALTTQVAELSKGPGDTHTASHKDKGEGDSGNTMTEEEAFMSYDHNKKAMEELKNIA